MTHQTGVATRPTSGWPAIAVPLAGETNPGLPLATLEHTGGATMLLAPVSGHADPSIVEVNSSFETLTGYSRSSVRGASPRLLAGQRGQLGWVDRLRRRMQSRQPFRERCVLRCANEDVLAVLVEAHPLCDSRGNVVYWLTKMHDLAAVADAQADQLYQSLHRSKHDEMTGLMNRVEFERRLAATLERLADTGGEHVLCYLDLDQFKVINDTCGHDAGDELLRQLGDILPTCVRECDTVARLSGDEFAVLLQNAGVPQARLLANRLREGIEKFRFRWLDKVFSVGVSIGMVSVTDPEDSVARLLSAADTACFAAKDLGRNRIHIHHHEDGEIARRNGEMEWVTQIQAALDEQRFRLYLQTIESLKSESAGHHYEVLLRMESTDGELITPESFLPAAENYHLSTRLDTWVVGRVLDYLALTGAHRDDGNLCCVNLSGHSITDAGFLHHVVRRLRRAPAAARSICFEITETAVIANFGMATQFIRALREFGCRFALDDFGAGLSSFRYLKNLPVDFLKIDGMFVRDMTRDPCDLSVVRAINQVGQDMCKQTVAEFVEDEATLDALRDLGVDFVQGYHISRPAPLL